MAKRKGAYERRWGVVLAGGDGVRLQPLTKFICGDERPKQFCPLFGAKTLLEETLRRSELIIPRKQLVVSLTSQHAQWYSQETGLAASQRIVQPVNKGTAPAILHSLLSIARLDERALVAILPCDHHYSNEDAFNSSLDCAFQAAAQRPHSVILLGAKPDYPEIEYGWIELGPRLGRKGSDLFHVRTFREKPVLDMARRLFDQGAVWNTFVMVGRVGAFLQMVQATLPELVSLLEPASLWAGEETHVEDSIYRRISSVSFSHDVLSMETSKLLVLRLNGVGWSDLGDPGRALMAVRDSGHEPAWMCRWKFPSVAAASASQATSAVA